MEEKEKELQQQDQKETAQEKAQEAEIRQDEETEHSSHHHSHHRSKKSMRAWRRIRHFCRKHKKPLIVCGALAVTAVFVAVSILLTDVAQPPVDAEGTLTATAAATEEDSPYDEHTVVLRRFDAPVELSSAAVSRFMTAEKVSYPESMEDVYEIPVTIDFEIYALDKGEYVDRSVIRISENPDYSDAIVRMASANERSVSVTHLKTGATYYCTITVYLTDYFKLTDEMTFTTAQTPRILSYDGATNVRDIGGWTTEDGYRVREDLLIRGSELDGVYEEDYCLTPAGTGDILTSLKPKSDFDLRGGVEKLDYPTPIEDYVERYYFDMPVYENIFGKPEVIRDIFQQLADKNNYPVYLHCTYGRDRTGTVCCLLEGLLGLSREDIVREYMLSTGSANKLDPVFDTLDEEYPADTTKEQVELYLLDIGVSQEEIDTIREIFLEKVE